MKTVLLLVVLLSFMDSLLAVFAPPSVQLYSRTPGQLGVTNILICHASGFYPPEITIKVLKNGAELPNSKQTDLAFEENWQYHMTKSVIFTPKSGEDYTCKVTHLGKTTTYVWVPDIM
ncbi:beta-2-microglobulin-like [Thalassophryne amazonica]|uniref:beta-2-microglobulin-like n=1 Tax=Thalassophryne amazonica TaxID=390379 RepID=UPI001471F8C7|nr:beta-2-microglobulin-like [Thalassophryne amazonica]